MNFWKKLSFNSRCIIGFVGGTLFIFCLLLFSCMGGIDDYTTKIESLATESATAFYIEWADGSTSEIDKFCDEEEERTLSELAIVTKKRVQVTAILLSFSSLPDNTNIRVYTNIENDVQNESNQEQTDKKETELGFSMLLVNEDDLFIEVSMTNLVTIEKDCKIQITFSKSVNLEYFAVDFEEVNEEVASSNA